MAHDSVTSIFSLDIDAIAVPDAGIVSNLISLNDKIKLHEAMRTNANVITNSVPRRPSARMTQIRLQKHKGAYTLLVDGVHIPPDENGITRIPSFHAGPQVVRERHQYNKRTGNQDTIFKYKHAPGFYDHKAKRSFVGPLLVHACIEADDVAPETVRIDLYQCTRVDDVNLTPRFLRSVPLKTHSSQSVKAPCVAIPFPCVHTHAPYIEIVDASNVREHEARENSGWFSWLFVSLLKYKMNAGGPLKLLEDVFNGVQSLPAAFIPTKAHPELFKTATSMVDNILRVFFSIEGFYKMMNTLSPAEVAVVAGNDKYIEHNNKYYDAALSWIKSLFGFKSANVKEVPESEKLDTLRTATVKIAELVTSIKPVNKPQPKRVRFTIRKLAHSLRQIRRIRRANVGTEKSKLQYGFQLQTSGYAEEKVLMEWIVEGDSSNWMNKIISIFVSAFDKFKENIKYNYKEPSRVGASGDDKNKKNRGFFSNNGPMQTDGLDKDFLSRNCSWIQIRVIVDDICGGYDTPIEWRVQADEDVGQKAAWIDSGYSSDVEDLKQEIINFRRNLSIKSIDNYGFFTKLQKQTNDYFFQSTGSEKHIDNFSQYLSNMRQTTRALLYTNVHKIGGPHGVGLETGGKLDVLVRWMQCNVPLETNDNTLNTNNNLVEPVGTFIETDKQNIHCIRIMPQRAVLFAVARISPEPLRNLDMEIINLDASVGVSRRFSDTRGSIDELTRVSRFSAQIRDIFEEWEDNRRELLFEIYTLSSNSTPNATNDTHNKLQRHISAVAERISFSPACYCPPYSILDQNQRGIDTASFEETSTYSLASGTIQTNQATTACVIARASFAESLTERIVLRNKHGVSAHMLPVYGAQRRTIQFVPSTVELLKQATTVAHPGRSTSLVQNRDPMFVCYPCGADAYRVLALLQAWDRSKNFISSVLQYASDDGSSRRSKHATWPPAAQLLLDAVITEYSKLASLPSEEISKLPFYALQNALSVAHLNDQTAQSLVSSLHTQNAELRLTWASVRMKVAESYASWERTMSLSHLLNCHPLSMSMIALDIAATRPIMLSLRHAAPNNVDFQRAVERIANADVKHSLIGPHKSSIVHTPPSLPVEDKEKQHVLDAMLLRNARLRIDVEDTSIDMSLPQHVPVNKMNIELAKKMFESSTKMKFWVPFGHGDKNLPSMNAFGPQGIESMPVLVEDIHKAAMALRSAHDDNWNHDSSKIVIKDLS